MSRLIRHLFSNSEDSDVAVLDEGFCDAVEDRVDADDTGEAAAISADMPAVHIEPASEATQAQSLLRARRIDKQLFVIGRRGGIGFDDPEGVPDLLIGQAEPFTISRRHCAVKITEEGVFVVDLGGRRGTLINDQRIGGRNSELKELKLEPGAHRLILGDRNSQMCFKVTVE